MYTHDLTEAAHKRIRPYIRETPLEHSWELSENSGCEVHLKLENLQITGSFKLRGALNKLLTLTEDEKKRGVLAASTGNHGAGVARGLKLFGISGTIFVPENAQPSKVAALRRIGANVKLAGQTCEMAEALARGEAERTGAVFISPYNDEQVIAGQGTIGREISNAISPDAIFVSVGGGGLIAGIASVLKARYPKVRVFGCSPENDCAMATSIKRGEIVAVDAKPTLSDGTAGGVEPGSITFDLCRDLIDEFVLVGESEIRSSLRWLLDVHHVLVEGAAAVALAGFLKSQRSLRGKKVVIVLCGANIGSEFLRKTLSDP